MTGNFGRRFTTVFFFLAGWEVKFSGPITRCAHTRLGEESGKGRKMGTRFRGATRIEERGEGRRRAGREAGKRCG